MSQFELTLKGLPIRQPSPGYVGRVLAQRPRPAAMVGPWMLRGWPLRLAASLALGLCLGAVVYWLAMQPGGADREIARAPAGATGSEQLPSGQAASEDVSPSVAPIETPVETPTVDTPPQPPAGRGIGRGGGGMGVGGMGAGGMPAPGRGAGGFPGGGFGGGMGPGGMGAGGMGIPGRGGGMGAGGMGIPGRGGFQGTTDPVELGEYGDASMGFGGGGMEAPGNRELTFAEGLSVRRARIPREAREGAPAGRRSAWGYVDYSGQWVIPPKYQIAGDFSSGIAEVQDVYDQPSYYVDYAGKSVDDGLVTRIRTGLVRVESSGKWGFLDPQTGEMVVEAKYDNAWDFSEGLACVFVRSSTPHYRWIDYTGREVIVLSEVRQGGSFHQGLAPVAVTIGGSGSDAGTAKYGFIDRMGKLAVEPQFDRVYYFSEGRAMVRVGRKFGYIDLAGKLVIPAEFDAGMAFSEGLAGVRIAPQIRNPMLHSMGPNYGGWGFIDPSGEFVFPPEFTGVTPFSHGVSYVKYTTPAFLAWDGEGEMPATEEYQRIVDHAGGVVLDVTGTPPQYPPEE